MVAGNLSTREQVIQKAMTATGKTRLTEKQEEVLNNYIANKFDAKKAILDAGVDQRNMYTHMRALKDMFIEVAETYLAGEAMQSLQTIVSVRDSATKIQDVSAKLDAAKTILDRIGLGKKDKVEVEHKQVNAIFVLPSKNEVPIETDVTKNTTYCEEGEVVNNNGT